MNKISNLFIFFFLFFILSDGVLGDKKDFFMSLKYDKVKVRQGPSLKYPVKFIYKKKYLPVKIVDTSEHFKKIIDLKNNSGWIHISQLKKNNSVIATEDKILFKKPSSFSKPIAQIKKGSKILN